MDKPDYIYVQIIDACRERVWEALTAPEFTEKYWHQTRIQTDLQPGSPVRFLVAEDEVGCDGEVLISNAPEELSYTWRFPRNPAVRDEAPSRVTFRLETIGSDSTGTATRLTVTHDRFPAGSKMPEMIGPGWPLVLAGLKTLLETGQTLDYSAMS
jgi:uncharacterized protein YndB with AHSA1/START domain